jgi:hypothetical protein
MTRLKTSTTVYVDNMSFYTAEEQVHFFFSQIGLVKKVIMGLNRFTFRPAGFCFVECAIFHRMKCSSSQVGTDFPLGFISDSTLWTLFASAMAQHWTTWKSVANWILDFKEGESLVMACQGAKVSTISV